MLVTVADGASAELRDAASRSTLVWSTSEMVEQTPNHFVQRSTLWIGVPDASQPRRLGEGPAPRLSPDGRWIAFSRGPNFKTYVISSHGGRSRLVAQNAFPGRWSPSSRYLAIAEKRRLYVLDVRTRRRVTIDRGATICGASFSPSGHEILWARNQGKACGTNGRVDLFRARVDGSERTRLTRDGRSSVPVWGSRGIAFARLRPSRDVVFPIYGLWMMRADGGGLRRLTRSSHSPLEWSAVHRVIHRKLLFGLALSRDGRSVLAWVPSTLPHGNLVRVDWDGTRTILWNDADEIADWNA